MRITKQCAVYAVMAGVMILASPVPETIAGANQYDGTAYVAGMGGHFAVAQFHIDPSADSPITVKSLDMIEIGDRDSHPTHDTRIDYKDRNTMFWSTYLMDEDADNQAHVGITDLRTGEKIKDVPIAIPDQVLNKSKVYCASGQTEDFYMPVSMSQPGYISVIRKSDMKLMHQVFLEGTEADIKVAYKFMHGVTSPDMKEMLITLNESDATLGTKDFGNAIGKMHMFVLDTASLVQGKVKVLRSGIADGNFKSTVSFRQYYSPDGKYISNATGDILFLIDSATLEVVDAEPMAKLEQTHDAIFTPDSKYVIATSRTKATTPDCSDPGNPKDGEWRMDGQLKLYDVNARKFVGKPVSTCLACHDEQIGTDEDAPHAVLCGIDVNWM